jgi:hypothetical protein
MTTLTPRALGFGEILDGGFTLYRKNFSTFFGVALAPQIPVILYWIGVMAFVPAGIRDFAGFLIFPWTFFATFLTLGALCIVTVWTYEGHDPGVRAPLAAGLRAWFPVAIAGVLAWLSVMFGVLFFILPGLFFLASFFAFAPVVMVEQTGPLRALQRSWDLSSGGRFRVLGITLVAYLIILIPMMAISVVGVGVAVGSAGFATGDPAAMQGAEFWITGLLQILGPVVSALTWPFFVAVLTLLYLDRRARTEAPDLEEAVGRLEGG